MPKPSTGTLVPLSSDCSPVWVAGADEISPKVLQALGTEPIQVRPCLQLSPAVLLPRGWVGVPGPGQRMRGFSREPPQPAPYPPSILSTQCLW